MAILTKRVQAFAKSDQRLIRGGCQGCWHP
jgi:hypothetical protein